MRVLEAPGQALGVCGPCLVAFLEWDGRTIGLKQINHHFWLTEGHIHQRTDAYKLDGQTVDGWGFNEHHNGHSFELKTT